MLTGSASWRRAKAAAGAQVAGAARAALRPGRRRTLLSSVSAVWRSAVMAADSSATRGGPLGVAQHGGRVQAIGDVSR